MTSTLGLHAGRRGRILHVISSMHVGGAEVFLRRLAGGLAREGWESCVISLAAEGGMRAALESDGIEVVSPGWRMGVVPGAGDIRRLQQLARELRPDVIQGWMPHGNLAALLLRGTGVVGRAPVFWSVHQSLDSLQNEKLLTRVSILVAGLLSRFVAGVVYVSDVSRLQHEARGYARSRGLLIRNGVDTRDFAPDRRRGEAFRASLGIASEATVIGHVGRFHPQKDYLTLARSMELILESRPGVEFVLAGRGLEAGNRDLIALHDVFGRRGVHLVGPQADVVPLMSGINVFCLSSAFGEAFPMVLLEAMACGVQCVATEVGDCGAILGGTGRIVPPKDPRALAGAIAELVDQPAANAALRSAEVRCRIEENFSLDRAAALYADAYGRSLLRRGAETVSRP